MNKSISLLITLTLLHNTPYASEDKSKYQLQTAGNNAYLLNTKTGDVWFIQTEYNNYGYYDSTARKVKFAHKKDSPIKKDSDW